MCTHYWFLDSSDRGICKKCGDVKDFSPPPIRLTKLERSGIKTIHGNNEYCVQGTLRIDKMYSGKI